MRRLPLYNDLWQESLKRDDFTIITVAGDDRDTMPRLRKLLKDNKVQFPVLHYLEGDEGGQFDYDVGYYGYDMLVDREGVIVDNIWVREDFIDLIEFLDAHGGEIPRISMEMSEVQHEDGSFTTTIVVSRSDHQPLEVYYGGWYQFHGDPEMERFLVDGEDDTRALAAFGEFGDFVIQFDAEPRENLERYYVYCWANLPGTESLYDGDWLTIISDRDLWYDEEGNLLDR